MKCLDEYKAVTQFQEVDALVYPDNIRIDKWKTKKRMKIL